MDQIIEGNEINYNEFDKHSHHIIQSSIWGKFKQKFNSKSIYLAKSDYSAIWTMYISHIPHTKLKFGVMSQCQKPTNELIYKLREIAKRESLFFIKIEPLVENDDKNKSLLEGLGLKKGINWFLENTFILDLNSYSIEDIFSHFSTSTRRNIRIAQKKEVEINIHEYVKGNYENINNYLKIQEETTKRKNFASHDEKYFHILYDTLEENLLIVDAKYNNEIIASIILYKFNDTVYYPHGASMHKYIETKSSNLLLYEAIKYAFNQGFKFFNFWGALGENPDPNNSLYGTHNFKKGFGGKLNQYIGAYDLAINLPIYTLFNVAYSMYWRSIKLKRKLKI